jgi:hypothetical protein
MENVLQIRLTVRKYLWHEFVRDTKYFIIYLIRWANALSWVILHRSLLTLIRQSPRLIKKVFWITMICMWTYLFIRG